jgi:hypothetical protein
MYTSISLHLFTASQMGIQTEGINSRNNRIQKFDSNGKFITKYGSMGTGDGQFNGPGPDGGASVGSSGNVYVADTYNDRIQAFAPYTK